MSTQAEQLTRIKVGYWLKQSGESNGSTQRLLAKYAVPLNRWIKEYLYTGSHMTPEDFADQILQAEASIRSMQDSAH